MAAHIEPDKGTDSSAWARIQKSLGVGVLVVVIGGAIGATATLLFQHEGCLRTLEAQVENLSGLGAEIGSLQDLQMETRENVSELRAQMEIIVSLQLQMQNLQSQIQNLQSTVSGLEGLAVSIVEPKDNAVVRCEALTEDNQCAITVHLEIAGILPEAARARMLVRVEGGEEWWVSGGEGLPGPDDKCSVGFVTLGSADGPDQRYELMAIVTEQVLEPGSLHAVIPDHIAWSPSVVVLVKKGTE